MHPVGQFVSVFLLLFKDLLNQAASSVVFIPDQGNHLCVGLDSHPFGNEVGPNHGMQVQLFIVVSVTAVNKRGRIEVRLTTQLDNACSYSVGMGLLLVGMHEKFTGYGWRGQARSREVMTFVSQNADQFGGQGVIQQLDDVLAPGVFPFNDGSVIQAALGSFKGLGINLQWRVSVFSLCNLGHTWVSEL